MGIPNILTILRLASIPPLLYSYLFMPRFGERIALIIFIFSGITDVLDGLIARKYNLVTKIGTVLDPLADKMILVSVLTVFAIKNKIGFWILLTMALKELLMIYGAYLLYRDRGDVIQANSLGKISTIMFYIASLSIMLNISAGYLLMIVFVMLNIISLFIYFFRFISIKKVL